MSPIPSNRYDEAIFAIGIIKKVTGEKRQGVVSTPPPGVRGLITDFIILYKIIHQQICLNFSDFSTSSPCTITRGHPYRITVPLAKNNVFKNSFSCRIPPIWNALPTPVVLAPSVFAFKRLLFKTDLTKFVFLHHINSFHPD